MKYSTTEKYTVFCIFEHKEVFKKNKLLIKNNFRKATQYSLLCLIKSMVLLGVYSLLCMRIKSMVLFGVSDITDVTNDPCSEWRRRRVFMIHNILC